VPGIGSTFTFSLPFAPGRELPLGPNPKMPQVYAQGLRILVAEDNATNAMVAKEYLEDMSHQTEVVSHGSAAIDAIRAAHKAGNGFDLVFMDVEMPGMDGFEATKLVRGGGAGETVRDIPIVAMTAHAVAGFRDRCLAVGMDDYVSKPVDFSALPEIITAVLAAKRNAAVTVSPGVQGKA